MYVLSVGAPMYVLPACGLKYVLPVCGLKYVLPVRGLKYVLPVCGLRYVSPVAISYMHRQAIGYNEICIPLTDVLSEGYWQELKTLEDPRLQRLVDGIINMALHGKVPSTT